MGSENTTFEALTKGATKGAGERHTFVVERLESTVFELQEHGFQLNGSVLLPVPLALTVDGAPTVGALVTVAAALEYAASAGQKLIVTGHAAGGGSPEADRELSELRARNVELYLRGDRSGWAAACDAHQWLDAQHLLRWASYEHGYACDPTPAIDQDPGSALLAALARFRAAYNAEFGKQLELKGPLRTPDWEAFYDLYDKSLAQALGVEASALAGKRSALTWIDPPSLACGPSWPAPAPEVRSGSGNRVDLMFIEDGTLPDLKSEEPPGSGLYGLRSVLKRTYQVQDGERVALKLIVLDAMREPLAGKPYKLTVGEEAFEAITGGDGDLEQQIPKHALFGELVVFLDDAKKEALVWELMIGQLPPVAQQPGVQARLNLLGVYAGHPAVGQTQPLPTAVEAYQLGREGLTPSGDIDDDTRGKVDEEHSGLS